MVSRWADGRFSTDPGWPGTAKGLNDNMEPLNALYATQDEIPEAFRPLYEERGGQFHLTKINGLKTDADIARVQRSLEAERGEHGKLKTAWGNFFKDKKPEDIQAMLDRIPELELASKDKLDDEKLGQIVEGRLRGKLAPIERERDQFKNQLGEATNLITQFQQREKTRTIHDAVREAAGKTKMIPSAVEDMLMYAERVFDVGEDGKVTVKEGAGTTEGVTPDVWLTEMQVKRPHWWPMSSGGGANGGGVGAGADNPWTGEGWNLTKQGQIARENPARAEMLAKAAGHAGAIGATRPKPKK